MSVLIGRYQPILARWLHGRLPDGARDLSETADLVQLAMLRTMRSMPSITVDGPGAFFGFLRQVAINLLRDEVRRCSRRPLHQEISPDIESGDDSPLGIAIDAQTLSAYEAAMEQFDQEQRQLLIMRIELGLSHQEIAQISDSPSPDAVRVKLRRLLMRLAQSMADFKPN